MLLVKELNKKDFKLCFELDSKAISLWSEKQWESEFQKEGVKVFGISHSELLLGICSFQVVLGEAQINYFAINNEFQRKGLGTFLMNFLINQCAKLKLFKLSLEVSESNLPAIEFYKQFNFLTVGIRKNYYKDGTSALLKEKTLTKK